MQKILQFDMPISQMRLHPNHLVTGSSAANYIFLLQHGNDEVVEKAVTSLTDELELLKDMLENSNMKTHLYEAFEYIGVFGNLVFSVLEAALDREPKVRSHVPLVLGLLLRARLIHPMHFYPMTEVVLEKLGDPDVNIKNAFTQEHHIGDVKRHGYLDSGSGR